MCIMNTVFLELIERYPRVKKHFEEVAKLRRNEFRRLQLQALRVFENLEKEKEQNKEANEEFNEEQDEDKPSKQYFLKNYLAELDGYEPTEDEINTYGPEEKKINKQQKMKENATKKAQEGVQLIEHDLREFKVVLEELQDQFKMNIEDLSSYLRKAKEQGNDAAGETPEMKKLTAITKKLN